MGFDLDFVKKDECGQFDLIESKFNDARYTGNYKFCDIIQRGACVVSDSEYFRPEKYRFESLKKQVLLFNINSDIWLEALELLEKDEDIYLYESC